MGIVWLSGEKEVKSACHLLTDAIYKGLSKKLRKESEDREYRDGIMYSCQALFRDTHVKNVDCKISEEVTTKGGLTFPVYIAVGLLIFKLQKIDGYRQHANYSLDMAITNSEYNNIKS